MKKESLLSSFPLKDLFKEKDIAKNLFSSMMMTWVLTGCVIVLVLLMPKFMPSILNLSGVEGSYLTDIRNFRNSFRRGFYGLSCR